MKAVRDIAEVFEATRRAKAGATVFQTNFFPAHARLLEWIRHGELLIESSAGLALFLRQDRDFFHLYFCAGNAEVLGAGLRPWPELLVVDLVGLEAELSCWRRLFESVGFSPYARLCRLVRTGPGSSPASNGSSEGIEYALGADCGLIHKLLDRSFDPYAEQLPTAGEIERAIEARQILVARQQGDLRGLLFFETQGLSSTVRYWLVGEAWRGNGVGGALMRRYLELHHSGRRFTLWAIDSNQNALAKYAHYGFEPDGLVDQILKN
jgi:hypothetical protein